MRDIRRRPVLVIGATGLAGQAFARALEQVGKPFTTAARSGAEHIVDISDSVALWSLLERVCPRKIINCAAIVNVALCEERPDLSWSVNCDAVGVMADWAQRNDASLIHISTDHYYCNGGRKPHRETDPVRFTNLYARQKFAAEGMAQVNADALVLRTSIIGLRGQAAPTLVEWVIDAIRRRETLTLFEDAFGSSIDVDSFSEFALALSRKGAKGLFNLAAGEVYSKADLIIEIAEQMGVPLVDPTFGSVRSLDPPRATDLGLDVRRAEKELGVKMPCLRDVVKNILNGAEVA